MACQYCGNSYVTDAPFCEGCGSGKTVSDKDRADAISGLQIDMMRALLARKPDDFLRFLDAKQADPAEDERQRWIRRSAKIALCLLALMFFPQLFLILFVMLTMFAMWVYLPYRGLKALFTWIAS